MKARKGVALVTSLVFTGAAAVILAGTIGYVSHTTRMAAVANGRDLCRLAAVSEIELAKSVINDSFVKSISTSAKIIGGDALGLSSTSCFDWFESYHSPVVKRTIGTKNTVTLANVVTNGSCTVQVRIADVDHTAGCQWAKVTIIARAERRNPGGTVSSAIIEETVRFAQARSKVFNNAYFVNNYGWFQGSGCTANGDVKANGNMYLDSSCTINGEVHAAKNAELGVNGTVDGYGQMIGYSSYQSNTGYGTMARPLKTDPKTGGTNAGGYDAPVTTSSTELRKQAQARVSQNEDLTTEMPYIGDIYSDQSPYREWAKELQAKDSTMCKITQGGAVIADKFYDGVGPSGDAALADKGALLLIGTRENPIKINGPVIVASDVLIKGYVTGQGTIYSGRNIHILGSITYVNPPSWSGKSMSGTDNSSKDMLGLMAKGNIVLGDYTASAWHSAVDEFLSTQPYVQKYACDTTDSTIGYPATFGGSYLVQEKISGLSSEYANAAVGGYDSATGKFGKVRETTVTLDTGHYETIRSWYGTSKKFVYDTETVTATTYDRKYYETVCNDKLIQNNWDGSISRIDAVLYNNHGIFGKTCSNSTTVNGALVCRNEGISYGAGGYSAKLYLNWDIRLYSGASDTVDNDRVGLAKSSDNPPTTVFWRELPEGVVQFE